LRKENICEMFRLKMSFPFEERNLPLTAFAIWGSFVLLCQKGMDYRIQAILDKIETDISRQFVISDLAASADLSVSRLQHLFKKEMQTSLVKYINNLRLEKARGLLETSHLHVKEIRIQVGVTNESHFQSDFKRKFGVTPNNYRRIFRDSRNRQ
jgi:AraC family transcriptional regulator of arabinose operon